MTFITQRVGYCWSDLLTISGEIEFSKQKALEHPSVLSHEEPLCAGQNIIYNQILKENSFKRINYSLKGLTGRDPIPPKENLAA